MRETWKYEDIIHLPHPVSKKYPPMPAEDRAAQFAPFAALTGQKEAIRETGRWTEQRIDLDESRKADLDCKLQMLREQMQQSGEIQDLVITYFQPDQTKGGGAYEEITGRIRKIDTYEGKLHLADGRVIPITDLYEIEGALFESLAVFSP